MHMYIANSKGGTDIKKKKKLNRRDTGHIQLSYYRVDYWEIDAVTQNVLVNVSASETMCEIPRKEKVKQTEKGVGL